MQIVIFVCPESDSSAVQNLKLSMSAGPQDSHGQVIVAFRRIQRDPSESLLDELELPLFVWRERIANFRT